jgi:hypothetical protein
MRSVTSWLGIVRRIGQKAGPYLMLEMLLPGGSLFALLLFLWQRRKPNSRRGVPTVAEVMMRARTLARGIWLRATTATPARVSYPQCSATIGSEP